MEATKQNLESALENIGWSLKDKGNGFFFIYDHEGNNTGCFLFGDNPDRIEVGLSAEKYVACCFHFKDIKIEFIGGGKGEKNTVCISAKDNDSVFLLFMNHNLTTNP